MTKTLLRLLVFLLFISTQMSGQKTHSPAQLTGLMFTLNKGQVADDKQQARPDILFKGKCNAADVYLRKTGISYVRSNMAEGLNTVKRQLEQIRKGGKPDVKLKPGEDLRQLLLSKQTVKVQRVDVDFVNANSEPEISTGEQYQGVSNYFYGHCPQGITNVPSYNQVALKNIYNNIDIKYYGGDNSGLKYDIVVNPGGNPNQIKFKYSGIDGMSLQYGKLYIKTSSGEIEERMPKVYQNLNGRVVDVKAEYVLTNNNLHEAFVEFKFSEYDQRFPLIIDPFVWATYVGGSGDDYTVDIATDAAGNSVACGYTMSTNFPVSPGAFQTTFGGADDAFIIKFDPAGARLWATYYGGTSSETCRALTVDPSSNIIFTGYTTSTDFPVLSAYQSTHNGAAGTNNIYLVKLGPNGLPVWATYYGGSTSETPFGVASDAAGNIAIVAVSSSADFPTTTGAFQTTEGSSGMIVAKFNPAGTPVWCTWYGQSVNDQPTDVGFDAGGNVGIVGMTSSYNFPVSAGAFQPLYNGGSTDLFIAKFNPTGTPIWSTYFGGSSDEGANTWPWTGLAFDSGGNMLIAGRTASTDFPVTAGVFQTVAGGGGADAYVVKIDPNGNRVWATYHGGNNWDWAFDIAVDGFDNAYVFAEVEDADFGTFPMNTCALQKTFGGIEDWIVTKFNPSGNRICSTYIGGTAEDDMDFSGGGIATYKNYVFVTAMTEASGFPVTSGAFQTIFGGGGSPAGDGIVAKFCGNSCGDDNMIVANFSNAGACKNSAVQFNPAISSTLNCDTTNYTYKWTFTGATPSSSTERNPSNIFYSSSGTFNVRLIINAACGTDTVDKTITINNCACTLSSVSNVGTAISCIGATDGTAHATVSAGSGGPYTYTWSNGTSGTTSVASSSVSGLAPATYTVTISDGACSTTSTVTIGQPAALSLNAPVITKPTCGNNNGSAIISASGGTGSRIYSWSNGTSGATAASLSAGIYSVTVTDANNCSATSVVNIINNGGPSISSASGSALLCKGGSNGNATVNIAGGAASYTYNWSTGNSTVTASTTNSQNNLSAGIYTITVTDAGGCKVISTVTVTEPAVSITYFTQSSNVTCTTNGSAGVSVTSGTGPYTYTWSTGQTSGNLQNIPAGSYTVTVTDGNGCTVVQPFNLSNSAIVSATFTQSPSGTVCIGASVNFSNTGTPAGTGINETWNISPTTASNVSGTTDNLSTTFLNAGTYSITHYISNGSAGCSNTIASTINVINCSSPTVTAAGNTICSGSCAVVTSSPLGGTSPYNYLWSNGATSQNINPCPVSTTTYTVTITDAGSNTATTTATVTVNPAIGVTATPTTINCFGGTGSVAASNSGGTSPFTYSWSNSQTTATINGLSPGNYTVTVTDSKGCSSTSTAAITQPAAISFTASQSAPATCGSNNGVAVATTATGGTGSFGYNWSSGAIGLTAGTLVSGIYTVTATDANGCTTTSTAIIGNSPAPTINSITPTQLLCNGAANGSAVVSATGTGTLTYSWTNGNTSVTTTNLNAGTYYVTVTDGSGCNAISSIVITSPPALTVPVITPVNASCGNSNGSAVAVSSGGTGALTYSWSNTISGATDSGLAAGNYTVTVKDANSCAVTNTIAINNSGGPVINSVTGNNPLCASGTGNATASASGGTGTLTYTWSNTNSGTVAGNLSAGIYTVSVTDANSCVSTSTVSISIPPAIATPTVTPTNATCGSNNGSAVAASSGGTGPLTYSWSNTASGTTTTGLAAGIYTVTVTDINSCTATNTASIINSGGPAINSVTVTNPPCSGGTGTAVANASGGTGALTYTWSNTVSAATATGLATGNYTITVKDANACVNTSIVSISVPAAISLAASQNTPASCGNNNGVAVTTAATGGTGAITYLWSNGSTGLTASSLPSGTYTVTATDSKGCTASSTAILNNSPAPVINSITPTQLLCNGASNASAVVSASGTGTLSYTWTNGNSAVTSTNLNAGTYYVTVTDGSGCNAISSVVITSPPAITVPAITPVNTSCGNNNGSAVALSSGGTGALTYSWSNTATGQTASGLSAATYTVSVTDANACVQTNTVVIGSNNGPIVQTTTPVNELCNGNSTGSVAITISGGSSPYTYSWSNSASSITSLANNSITNLPANTYIVTITDKNGCTATASSAITEPAAISTPVITPTNASCGASDGSAIASASGGTGSLTYSWSTTATGQTATGLSAVTYTVTVTDANGCFVNQTIAIGNSNGPSVQTTTPVNELCNGGSTGSANVTITGGSAPYTYSWSNGTSSITNSPNNSITAVLANTYIVTITDNNNCSVTTSLIITEPSAITIPATSTVNSTCGNANGSATALSTGGTGTLTYSWTNLLSGSSVTGLSVGTYTLTVTDANNCSVTKMVSVGNDNAPAAALSVSSAILCNGGTGSITATATGGNPNYTYSWSTGTSSATTGLQSTLNNLTSAIYTVTITDVSGCSHSATILLPEPIAVVVTSVTPVNSNCGTATGSIFVSASGGTGALTYNWSNAVSGQTNSSLIANTYTLTVTDANACSVSQTVTINNNGGPVINSITPVDELCNGASTGSASIAISGGTSPYTYSWSNGTSSITNSLNNSITAVLANTYIVTITDANGCQQTSNVTITEPSAIIVTGTNVVNATCGTNNGSALATATGGTGSLTYSWSNSVSGRTNTALAANTYTLSVTDAAGCKTTQSVPVSNSPAPTITGITPTNVLCNGNSTGSAVVTANGGTGTLTYSWSSGSTTTTATNLSAAIYTVTVTDAGGCQQLSVVTIAQPPAITVTNISTTSAGCSVNNGTAIATATGGVPVLTYSWSNSVSGQTNTGLAANSYTLTITDANGCAITNTVTINSTNGPTAITSIAATVKCNGQTGSVTATASNGTLPYTYSWSTGATSVTTSTQSTINNQPSAVYSVTITDKNGCTSTSSVTLSEPPALITTSSKTDATCGNADGNISVTIVGGTPDYTYSWSNGFSSVTTSLSNMISLLNSGTYVVTVTDANGCTQTILETITNSNGPVAGAASSQTTITEGNSTILIGSSTGSGINYTWTPSSSLSCSNCAAPTANPGTTTTYTLYVKDDQGCLDSTKITITVKKACTTDEDVYIANVFSPNGDGKNDVLNVEGTGLTNIYWAIYDRWGNLLFETSDQAQGWDGTKNGSPMESATYVYYLKAICKKTNAEVKLKGNVSIVK